VGGILLLKQFNILTAATTGQQACRENSTESSSS